MNAETQMHGVERNAPGSLSALYAGLEKQCRVYLFRGGLCLLSDRLSVCRHRAAVQPTASHGNNGVQPLFMSVATYFFELLGGSPLGQM